jgi:hypothetical protein
MKASIGLLFTVVLLSSLCSARARQGSVHLWTFDDSGGTQAADVVGERPGTVHGAQAAPGRLGGALRFDGFDDFVALPDNKPVWLPTRDFTISLWVSFERDKGFTVAESEVLFDGNHGASSDPSRQLGYNVQRRGDPGKIAFQITTLRNADEDLYSQTVPAQDKWYHIVAVRQGTMQRIYLDGELDAWRVCSSSPVDFEGGYDDDRVSVGRYTTNTGSPRYHFKGMLDEVAIFDWALSGAEVRQLYLDSLAAHALYVDAAHGSDLNDGRRALTAFATIQAAIDTAQPGDEISVLPGVYCEALNFLGKAVTVQSRTDAAVIEAPGRFGVSFYMGEGRDSVLRNLIIANSFIGIFCAHSAAPTITNVTVVGNVYGAEAYGRTVPRITNSIFWGNSGSDLYGCPAAYCCVERGAAGEGNFREDPLLVDPENGDYHLRSQWGRYWPEHDVWVLDEVTSPCIDAGDPEADFSAEREPNGGRRDVGAHGGTAFANVSVPPFSADLNGDGVVDAADLDLFTSLWQQQQTPSTTPPAPTPSRRR